MNLFNTKKKNKTVIVCFHGFGRRRTDDFLPLVEHFKNEEVIVPELYNIHDPKDNQWTDWVSRAEDTLNQLAQQGKRVILVGFSMGGVIASYCASKPNVDKLVLISPAFEYFNLSNASTVISSLFENKEEDTSPYPEVPTNFTTTFTSLVDNCKIAVEDIQVPTLLVHGNEDDVIMVSSSRRFFKKIPTSDKFLLVLEGVSHQVLSHPTASKIVLENIQLFIDDKIIINKQ